MAFWKKNNERRKRELEGIKSMVEGRQPLPPPLPTEDIEPIEEPEEPTIQPETPPTPPPAPRFSLPEKIEAPEPSAPLFIKIEKYEDVLEKLQELKKSLQTLTRLMSFHAEVDELKTDIFTRIKNNVSQITDILISMDEIFVRPERPDITEPKKKGEEEGIEEQILDLGEELRHLKRDLSQIE